MKKQDKGVAVLKQWASEGSMIVDNRKCFQINEPIV